MVAHAIAEGHDPHVRTRFRWSKSAAAKVEALKALAIVDLVGALVEDDPKSPAARTDRQNALDRCREGSFRRDPLREGFASDCMLSEPMHSRTSPPSYRERRAIP